MSENETVDDVLADMLLPRFDAITAMRANNYDEIKSLVANYRDRIKAAYKREVEKFNSVIQATVSSSDAEIDHLRREREKLRKTLAQMAQTATAARTCNTSEEILRITYLDDIAKMCADALALFTDSPQNDNSGAANVTAGKQELNANSKSAQIEFGNVAKLREALGKLRAELWNNTVIAGKKKFALYEIADAALAAPARQCDVGTADEQGIRLRKFCVSQKWCDRCPLRKPSFTTHADCKILWMQLPYEESGVRQ